jgi:energy-coupling factor transporter ATP-binding protein EcfA2
LAEFIYTMYKARKAVGDKLILDDVTMSFYPGAKIGMVGPNGAGKSTILKIMAGLDEPSNGEARLSPGYSVGILLQEPPLDESKTVLENVQEGMGDGEPGCRLRRPDGGDGHPADGDRRRERLGPRLPARAGHGRPALPARGRVRRPPLRW